MVLASYARDAKARVELAGVDALATVRKALEESLGLKFEGEKGEHFFRSTLVQTLFYGVFSGWVLWSKEHPPSDRKQEFDWNITTRYLKVPILRKLYHEVAEPGQLDDLNLSEVLDWTCAVLNRVDRNAFFANFNEGEAVQYFYEPFLEAFDPQLRKDLGVWYTPNEIVQYMVARVDTVLREELDRPDGLADKDVYVLDPCCGTGAFLVEVLKRIATTLRENGGDALLANDLKQAAMERIFGFEILPSPFVIAHLQLGLLLQNLGAPLADNGKERVGVYLTNALTGWEPPKEPKTRLLFREMEEERDAAEHVKQQVPILVVIGNPPYNGYAGVAVAEERELTNAYRTTKLAPPPQGQGLNDLYIRFYRMAERRIAEKTGEGVICFISNYSWLDGLSFTGMRERYLEAFDHIAIDCLNGDKYKTGKLTPEGDPDPSIFSTEWNREGIQVGTAISLLVRQNQHSNANSVEFRNMWGKDKRALLIESVRDGNNISYQNIKPIIHLGLPFVPMRTVDSYGTWQRLPDLLPKSFPGVKTSRDDMVICIDRQSLVGRMEKYFDPRVSHEEMETIAPGSVEETPRFKGTQVRDYLLGRGFLSKYIVRCCYRPFDTRWLYSKPETDLLERKRQEYFPEIFEGNLWIAAVQQNRKEFDPPIVTPLLSSSHVIERGANLFPLLLRPTQEALFSTGSQLSNNDGEELNLSEGSIEYLNKIGAIDSRENLFYHVISVLHSPAYKEENEGSLRQD